MLSLPLAAGFAAAIVSTSFISGIFGMAGGMILMGILLAFMPLAPAMVLHGLVQMASRGRRAWQWGADIDWRIVAHYAASAHRNHGDRPAAFKASKSIALIIVGLTPFLGLRFPVSSRPTLDGLATVWLRRPLHPVAAPGRCVRSSSMSSSCAHSSTAGEQVATKAAVQLIGHVLKAAYFGHLLCGGEPIRRWRSRSRFRLRSPERTSPGWCLRRSAKHNSEPGRAT